MFGNYCLKVLGQGLCSSQDLFNYLTRGTTLTDTDFQIVKNVDDFLIWAATLEELEVQINKLMEMCKKMNLKLSPAKFKISDSVKFGGTIISSKKLKDGHVIFMDPPDKRVVAVTEMPNPKNKKEVRVLCGMISSLAAWFPNVQFNTSNLRAACAENRKFEWNEAMANEFKQIKHVFKTQIRLSPLDPSKRINIITDGANSTGIGFILLYEWEAKDFVRKC